MKRIRLSIILFLLLSFAKGQTMRIDCDTLVMKDGSTYYGIVTAMNDKVIKFINCDIGLPIIKLYLKDIKTANYNRIQYNLEKLQQQKNRAKGIENPENPKKIIDTTRYIHFGIIPYLLLTRSSALYVRYDLKNTYIEYRPSYTYATNQKPSNDSRIYHDNFFFQGINNSLLFYLPHKHKTLIALMLSYKYWWHGKMPIYSDDSKFGGISYGYYLQENRSTVMNGVELGIEFNHNLLKRKKIDFIFCWSVSSTYFNSFSHVYSISSYNSPLPPVKTYPYTETKNRVYFNITCGIKLGYKKKLK